MNKNFFIFLLVGFFSFLLYSQQITDKKFNPAISIVLNSGFSSFDLKEYNLSGFDIGHPEGRIESEGFYLNHNEISISSNVDNLFYGQATIVLVEHEGSDASLELEEAFIQSLGLPFSLKFGRILPTFAYLNELHFHQDFFIERPLSYQAFVGGHMIEDGMQINTVLPIDTYVELGLGLFSGRNYPSTVKSGVGVYTLYGRIGGDINESTSWRSGISYLKTSPEDRAAGHAHGHDEHHEEEEEHHEDGEEHHEDEEEHHEDGELSFTGDSQLFALDFKLEWSPNGNSTNEKLEVRAEYFFRKEEGTYHKEELNEDDEVEHHDAAFDGTASGFYLQGVYKFHRKWAFGLRYDSLVPEDKLDEELHGTVLDAEGDSLSASTLSFQYANSEFSRIRLSYSRVDLAEGEVDNRLLFNFQVSLGAHGAHTY